MKGACAHRAVGERLPPVDSLDVVLFSELLEQNVLAVRPLAEQLVEPFQHRGVVRCVQLPDLAAVVLEAALDLTQVPVANEREQLVLAPRASGRAARPRAPASSAPECRRSRAAAAAPPQVRAGRPHRAMPP